MSRRGQLLLSSVGITLITQLLCSCFTLAIIAFLLVSASFAIGLKCYLDFDRGLLESKVNSELSFDTIPTQSLKVCQMSQGIQGGYLRK